MIAFVGDSATCHIVCLEVDVRLQDRFLAYNEAFARKLSVDQILEGHEGCVNRVCWSEDGTLLASASDERKVRLGSWRKDV